MNRLAFTTPTGLWALAAVAVVAVLYLLYRRYRPQPVTGLFLWGTAPRHSDGGRRLDSPLKNRSFWYDILAATLLALVLAGPVLTTGQQSVVIILDNSFAMRSRDNHRAAAAIASRLMDDADQSALILAGARPRLVLDFGHTATQTAAAISDHYRADEQSGDLAAALALASDVWGETPTVHVVTNQDAAGTAHLSQLRINRHLLAGRGDNLAITDAWRQPSRTEPGRDRVVALVRNWSRTDRTVRVMLQTGYGAAATSGERLIEEIPVPAGGGRFVEFTVPQSPETVWLAVGGAGEDVIPDDSRLALPPPDRRRPTFRFGNAESGLDRFVAPALRAAGAVPAADGDTADILVVSGWEPDGTARGVAATLAFVAPGQPGIPAPPYHVEAGQRLTEDVDLSRVVWTAATGTVATYPVARELIAAGPLPLVWLDNDDRVVVNAYLAENDLFRHAAWPVLVGNLVEDAADNLPGLRRRIVHPGDPLRIVPEPGRTTEPRLYRDDIPLTVTRAGGSLTAPREPGLYTVRDGDAAAVTVSVVPNFGAAGNATVLSDREGVIIGDAAVDDPNQTAGAFRLDWLALGLAALPLFLNWRRRREGR